MKLTTKHGTYAKRVKPLVIFLFVYLGALEEETISMVSDLAGKVRYFKAKKVYITGGAYKLNVDTQPEDGCCNVMLETFLEDGAVCCNDSATLVFPSLSEVLEQEMILSGDIEGYREKYSDYLK